MKVLHLIQRRQLRGAEVFAARLAQHTTGLGHEAILVALFDGEAALPFDGEIISLGGSKKKRFLDIAAWRRLARIIREKEPEVVQANAGDTLKYAVLSKLLFRWRQPIVFRNASTISLYIRSHLVKWLNQWFFHYASSIVSVSISSARDMDTLYPALGPRISVIPIGVEDGGKAGLAALLPGEGPKLVHVGGFTFEKNHLRLFAIFRLVLGKYPAATLHLVGDGPLREDMEDLVQRSGLSLQVRFHGACPDAERYIRSADVLVLPSVIEGLPGAILEAFYCCTPVVAYDVGGVAEIVKDKVTGRLIRKGDEGGFALAVVSLLEDRDLRDRMTRNAYAMVTGGYRNSDIALRFLSLYRSLCRPAQIQMHCS